MKTKENNRPQYDHNEAAGITSGIARSHSKEAIAAEIGKLHNGLKARAEKLEKVRLLKKYFGWSNKDLANQLKLSEAAIKNVLAPNSKKEIPKWVDAMLLVFGILKPDTLERIKAVEASGKTSYKIGGHLATRGDASSVWIDESQFVEPVIGQLRPVYNAEETIRGFRLVRMFGNVKQYVVHYEGGQLTLGDYDDAQLFNSAGEAKNFMQDNSIIGAWFIE